MSPHEHELDPLCRRCRESLDEWRRGELTPEEARVVEEHLEGCSSCHDELLSAEALGHLLRSAEPISPSAPPDANDGYGESVSERVRGRLMEGNVRSIFAGSPPVDSQGGTGGNRLPYWSLAAAALVVVTLGMSWLLMRHSEFPQQHREIATTASGRPSPGSAIRAQAPSPAKAKSEAGAETDALAPAADAAAPVAAPPAAPAPADAALREETSGEAKDGSLQKDELLPSRDHVMLRDAAAPVPQRAEKRISSGAGALSASTNDGMQPHRAATAADSSAGVDAAGYGAAGASPSSSRYSGPAEAEVAQARPKTMPLATTQSSKQSQSEGFARAAASRGGTPPVGRSTAAASTGENHAPAASAARESFTSPAAGRPVPSVGAVAATAVPPGERPAAAAAARSREVVAAAQIPPSRGSTYEAATAAKLAGSYAQAVELYKAAANENPGTAIAALSHVAIGEIALEYLQDGALAKEALETALRPPLRQQLTPEAIQQAEAHLGKLR